MARALAIETFLLGAAAVVAATTTVHPDDASAYALIVLMASAMGVRNAVVRSLAVPDLTTTVLTMTVTGFAAESRLAGGTGKGSVRRLAAVLAMLIGAVAGALLLKSSVLAPLGLAAVLSLVTCWSMFRPLAARRLARNAH